MKQPLMMLMFCGALAACGGSDDVAPTQAGHEVPASATTTPAAYATYAASLATDEQGDPVEVSPLTPPTSETDEPVDL
ncbi:hypothetical protein C7444_12335 [Sphaerotilus hippei]|uniref:Lipoprotein n=1 Tax=Sphaerotilus hippei TaxID=744406 RepID=A0A318GUQ7_9BURK|nr:hypothetical protein [Sphaerotilus hippei]PXW92784.1 hypothetical protein C7444_12335 [Sphaerotilus hippei]